MVTRARDFLTPGLCSLIKPAAMVKLMKFPAKIQSHVIINTYVEATSSALDYATVYDYSLRILDCAYQLMSEVSGINSWFVIPPPNEVGGGVYWIHLVCPSVCPSVCRRHGFRSISPVCFGISISNFICMLMVAIGRSLSIFSDVTFKMAAWRPYWIFWFPDSNFTLALNINFKLQRHNTYVYG